jgi:AcrR family transcriptional regulator
VQPRSEETRARLLETAARIFSHSGYAAAGVAEICAAAGVSKGAFYHHFPSKQAVFLQLLQDWLDELEAAFTAARRQADSAPQALLNMAGMMQSVFEVASGRLPMFLEFWLQANRDPAFWQATIAPYHRYRAFFQELIASGIAEGSLKAVDPALAAQMLVSLAVGLLLQGLLDPHGADWSEQTQRSFVHFITCLQMESQ